MSRNFDIDVAELLRHAEGEWLNIFSSLTHGLDDAIKGEKTHSDCPFPDNHGTSKGVNKFRLRGYKKADYQGGAICSCGSWNNGISLLMDVNNWSFIETIEEVNTFLGDPCGAEIKRLERDPKGAKKPDMEKARQKAAEEREKRKAIADERRKERQEKQDKFDKFIVKTLKQTWSKGISPNSAEAKPLQLYLSNRGIDPKILSYLSDDIRFHPNLGHYIGGNKVAEYPALMCLVRDKNGNAVTIHRIFLTEDGFKAELAGGEKAKQMMPMPSFVDVLGAGIRLAQPKRILGVSEGIETALAVMSATGYATWPAISDSLMANFDLDSVKNDIGLLLIWADKDLSLAGEKAAKALKSKAWELGIPCQIMMPPFAIAEGEKSMDWNDVLQMYGKNAFPRPDVNKVIVEMKSA
jgi:hypothetical protein